MRASWPLRLCSMGIRRGMAACCLGLLVMLSASSSYAQDLATPITATQATTAPVPAASSTIKSTANERIAKATVALLDNELLRNATIALAVVDVATGQIIESHQATRSQVPASLMKLTTTSTALAALGSGFRFQTDLCYSGRIVDGELQGDIVIVGGGDPTLGAGRPAQALDLDGILKRWVGAVQAVGIRRIAGRVIADESLLPGAEPPPSWGWDDIGNYYGAGAGGLNIHENFYTVRLQRSSQIGNRPIITGTEPTNIPIRWTNELSSAGSGSGDQSFIFGAPGSNDRVIRGTIPIGKGLYGVKGALPNPALSAATWLQDALKQSGIQVLGDPATSPAHVVTSGQLDTYYSPTLGAIAQVTNYSSVNLYAEAIYNALGTRWNTVGDGEATGDRLIAYWLDRGVPSEGWAQVDGSGLATANLITPLQLAQVLRKSVGAGIRETIPKVGSEGTVGRLLRNDPRADRLRAKSGTLARVRAFAGFAQRADGSEVAYVIVANNFTSRGGDIRRVLGDWMAALVE